MIRKANATRIIISFVAIYCNLAQGQSPSQTTLVVDPQNAVEYIGDISDPSKLATNPNVTPPAVPRTFYFYGVTLIADIVGVNGQPAKGTYVGIKHGIALSPAPNYRAT